jgi:hypothetical protein
MRGRVDGTVLEGSHPKSSGCPENQQPEDLGGRLVVGVSGC